MKTVENLGFIINSESIFKKEDFGKPIGESLSQIIRRNVSKDDYANVAIKSNVSFSTIRDVVYRTNSLTRANARAISFLIYAAFENSIATKLQAEGDTLFLDRLLQI